SAFHFSFSSAADSRHVPRVFLEGGGDGVIAAEAGSVGLLQRQEHALVILGHHFHKFRHHVLPEFEDVTAAVAAGVAHVPFDQGAHLVDLLWVFQFLQPDHGDVAAAGKVTGHVEHVGDAAGHARGKVTARSAEHDHATAGHVLATVVAHGLDDRVDAAVPDAEPSAGHPADISLAAGRAVKCDVAGNDVFLRHER